MKALVGAFNQEKAIVGAFSVIVQPVVEPMEHYTALVWRGGWGPGDQTIYFGDHRFNCSRQLGRVFQQLVCTSWVIFWPPPILISLSEVQRLEAK